VPLIVLEGPEGAGKSTQIKLLAEALTNAGRKVMSLREPGGTRLGEEIRKVLLHDAALDIVPRAEGLLFMAARAQIVEREIVPALARNVTVLIDRFFLSTYAYQMAGRGLPHDQVSAANKLATGALRPDLTILLTMPASEGMARAQKRGARDRMEQADPEFHERVVKAFAEFGTIEWQNANPEAGPIVTVDALGSEREVHERVMRALSARLPERRQEP
jgi:dTMP kinase